MKDYRLIKSLGLTISVCCILATPACCLEFKVTLDTSPLIGHPAGPFSLDFQLVDGSGVGDGNNTAIVTNLAFGLGFPSSSPSLVGGASGNLSTGISITDSSFFNDFNQQFTAGSNLIFTVQLTTNPETPQPDEFSFAILDRGGNEITTLGPADALLMVAINSTDPSIQTYATDPNAPPVAGGSGIDIPAAMVVILPEPATTILVGIGIMGLFVVRRRRW